MTAAKQILLLSQIDPLHAAPYASCPYNFAAARPHQSHFNATFVTFFILQTSLVEFRILLATQDYTNHKKSNPRMLPKIASKHYSFITKAE